MIHFPRDFYTTNGAKLAALRSDSKNGDADFLLSAGLSQKVTLGLNFLLKGPSTSITTQVSLSTVFQHV